MSAKSKKRLFSLVVMVGLASLLSGCFIVAPGRYHSYGHPHFFYYP